MSIDDRTLQVEITIDPSSGRRGGQARKAGPKVPEPPPIPRITRLMALAIKFQHMVDRGEVRDYADLAQLGYVSRARLTQIMNLLLLAPDIQEGLLGASPIPHFSESALPSLSAEVHWPNQRLLFGGGFEDE